MTWARSILTITLLAAAASAFAAPPSKRLRFADTLTSVEASFSPANAKPGDIVTWRLKIQIIPRWHTYPAKQADPAAASYVTKFEWPKDSTFVPEGAIVDPPGAVTIEAPESKSVLSYEREVVWEQKFRISESASNGEVSFAPKVRLTICDETCLQDRISPEAKLTISGGRLVAPPPPAPVETPKSIPQQTEQPANLDDHRSGLQSILTQLQKLKAPAHSGLWAFLLTAMFWGGVSLLTPCVFPMIPITVSFFLKQSEKDHKNPVLLALVYCATIIVVLGTASLTLLSFFTALSINPLMNLFIGALFVVLALSLFGMYDITLPTFLTRFTSSREGRGGVVGTIFMALTFTVVSFTCVAPFLGGFGGMAASGQFTRIELILGAFAFAATFAAPFFLLALFPSMLRRLPRSGGWLHTVKVVMGFVELAAALKFFRSAELVRFSEVAFFTYNFVLAAWVALMLLCAAYLFKFLHLGQHAEEEIGVSAPRFLTGFAFLSMAFYLVPALFSGGPDGGNQRPRGSVFAWIDAFLLPDAYHSQVAESQWTGDLVKAIAEARSERKATGQPSYVFVDFTGDVCTNCKLNERDVFSRGDIRQLLQKYRRVQLYTDIVPAQFYPPDLRNQSNNVDRQRTDAESNRWFQEMAFGDLQLPLYAILEPGENDVKVVGVYTEGKINDVAAFTKFLKQPLVPHTTLAER